MPGTSRNHRGRKDRGADRSDVIVVTGAAPLDPGAVAALPRDALVVAADGGLDHALAAGLRADVLVGDLDSVSPAGLAWATGHATVDRHPSDKADTDTELAIAYALSRQPTKLVLIGGAGDRLDHSFAALGALGAAALAEVPAVEAWWGTDHLFVATPTRAVTLDEPIGTTFSVLAMHGPADGVTISGARWPLDDVPMAPLVGRGVSNAVLDPPVRITVRSGTLTVVILTALTPGASP